ncbi:MAG TPA: class D sortase [Patescibacteria group bacterium]|nr:class D sortase [Patescibacteria group bacterium]
MNPLFPDEPEQPSGKPPHDSAGYVLSHQKGRRLEPGQHHPDNNTNHAIELIRNKVNALYDDEPNARREMAEAKQASPPRSKHQQFMYELSTSGQPLAAIQTAWHTYYEHLPDDDKRAVWQEFYEASRRQPSAYTTYTLQQAREHHPQPHHAIDHQPTEKKDQPQDHHGLIVVSDHMPAPEPPPERRSVATIKKQITRKVRMEHSAQVKAKQHLQSLLFGIGIGVIALVITLFSFFNEMVIAPFIRPGSQASATPIILSTDGIAPTAKNEVIIPKINVEIPVVYGSSSKESDIENSLESGVAHYASSSMPGQRGNAAFFGHSSNNIFNKGQYKFAFVLLHELVPGDIFYITNNGTLYTYKVYDKKIVQPNETWVLNPVDGKTATATLITCDPPGTSLRRLVVWGEQINPDPNANNAAPAASQQAPAILPSNSPSLWSRLWSWL